MKLDLIEIKRLHDLNFQANQTTREKAADDRVFSRVSQWDDGLLEDSQLSYRGEFNLLRKATRQIISDLRSNPVQVDFVPKDDDRDDGAELLDGLYLTDDRRNLSLEAYDNASLECVDCGVGGWELYTEYETNAVGDRNQVIRRRPVYEANNNSFPDANAKRLDKSDAMNWSILVPYTQDGYKQLYKELTGEETDVDPSNFASPEHSYTFPWISGENKVIYIVRFYHKELITDKVVTFADPFGSELRLHETDLDKKMDDETTYMDALMDQGYEWVSEKKIKRYRVRRYICSGEDILTVEDVPGGEIPVVHTYGERTFIEGEETWEGVVRLAKDPQRLRNFMLSYLADIVSRSPRPKPIFTPEQIAGFEHMYEDSGADNNYPYYLMNRRTANGEELSIGSVALMEGAGIPQGLTELATETRDAVKDVADAGLPNDIADPDLSGYAIEQLQARFDQQSMVYQQNLKFAKRRDAEIYAAMSSIVYDAPRQVTLTGPDGERRKVRIMDTVMNPETGEMQTMNDLTNMEFDVYAEIGPSYTSKKERTREHLGELGDKFAKIDPKVAQALYFKELALYDGIDLDDLREYANEQLMLSGVKKPKTDEEREFMQNAMNQPEKPDPNMVLAQAEQAKADAQMAREQRMAMTDQFKAQTDQGKLQIEQFKAQTDRMGVMVDAEKAGATINLDRAKVLNTRADTMKKLTESFRARASA